MNYPVFFTSTSRFYFLPRLCCIIGVLLIFIVCGNVKTYAYNLKVKVIKACENCTLPAAPAPCQSSAMHVDKAATWIPSKNIKIHAVSIPEQTEVSIYTDIEVSTAPEMYLLDGHIFRVKYAGPGILRNPPCDESFVGSNITTTNIVFPSGSWISVRAGKPVYVHMDVKNWSPYQIDHMTQDIYIYYSE
jgi:hypothetical protein